jgi:AhpD family alkylhydroperoxidase
LIDISINQESDAMYDMARLKKLGALGDGASDAMKAFWAFDKAAMADGAVPKKYKELIAVAVALTTQCPYCLELHRSAAETAGATQEELAETALIAAALRAGAAITHATHVIGGAQVEK